tara:strand:+ start:45 stop:347 length:303 start_codon:yes stop_codon:yes gene_type:complete
MSNITILYKGKFVQVDVVDETIELTVEDNVYSRSEALELIAELEQAEPFLSKKQEIDIVVEGGMVVEVNGLPVDWEYHVTDKDIALEGLVDEQTLSKKEW